MVSPQTVFTYPLHRAKLQILLHGVTANSLYLSFSPCKATNITTWCHRKQSLLILFTMQSYKSYYMVSPQTVFTYPFHHAKLQILLHGVTANSLYLSFSPCKATNLTARCHRKQSLLILFHHAKQILLHGVTANSLYLYLSPCKATNLTTWCHRKQSLLILFTMQSYKSYCMVSPQTVFTILFTMQSYKYVYFSPSLPLPKYRHSSSGNMYNKYGTLSYITIDLIFGLHRNTAQYCTFHAFRVFANKINPQRLGRESKPHTFNHIINT